MDQVEQFDEQFELIQEDGEPPAVVLSYLPKTIDNQNNFGEHSASIQNSTYVPPEPFNFLPSNSQSKNFPSREQLLAQEAEFFKQSEFKQKNAVINCSDFFATLISLLNQQRSNHINSIHRITDLMRVQNHLSNEIAFLKNELKTLSSSKTESHKRHSKPAQAEANQNKSSRSRRVPSKKPKCDGPCCT